MTQQVERHNRRRGAEGTEQRAEFRVAALGVAQLVGDDTANLVWWGLTQPFAGAMAGLEMTKS